MQCYVEEVLWQKISTFVGTFGRFLRFVHVFLQIKGFLLKERGGFPEDMLPFLVIFIRKYYFARLGDFS